jgi:hypothetical protein
MITRERPGRTDVVPSIVESMAITHPASVLLGSVKEAYPIFG